MLPILQVSLAGLMAYVLVHQDEGHEERRQAEEQIRQRMLEQARDWVSQENDWVLETTYEGNVFWETPTSYQAPHRVPVGATHHQPRPVRARRSQAPPIRRFLLYDS